MERARIPEDADSLDLLDFVDAGVPAQVLHRHLPVLRPCVGFRERPVIVASCARSEHPDGWRRPLALRGFRDLLLLTRHRLVVTSEGGLLRRLRLHLNLGLAQLADVAWTAEPERAGVQLAATAIDGIREHFWIRLDGADRVWWLDAVFQELFTAGGGQRRQPRLQAA